MQKECILAFPIIKMSTGWDILVRICILPDCTFAICGSKDNLREKIQLI
jgi:hypothetical protein